MVVVLLSDTVENTQRWVKLSAPCSASTTLPQKAYLAVGLFVALLRVHRFGVFHAIVEEENTSSEMLLWQVWRHISFCP